MLRILASKFIYPSDLAKLDEVLRPFEGLAIQLSFFQKKPYLGMDHARIRQTCEALNIRIETVHAPTVDVFDDEFFPVLENLRHNYGVSLVTIHPQLGDRSEALALLDRYGERIRKLGVILAYENFPSEYEKRKWIYSPNDLFNCMNAPYLGITFDTSHLDHPENCIEEFDPIKDKVKIVHLSDAFNGHSHQVLGAGVVPYENFFGRLNEIAFGGPVVIEYWPKDEERLIEDVKSFSRQYHD